MARGSLHLNDTPSLELNSPDSTPPGAEASIEPAPDRIHRAAKLADFGLPDDGPLGATLYTAHVLVRRVTLQLARRRLEAALQKAREALDDALLPLGKALCAQQDDRTLSDLAPLFEEVETARRAARDKDTAREQVRASSASVQRELDDSRNQSETTASRIRAQEADLAAQETQLRTQLKRAQALVQRCDIELRAIQTAVTPPDPAKLDAIVKQRQQRQTEAQTLNDKLTALLGELGETRRSLASARGVMSDLEGKRLAQEARHQKVDRKHAKHTAKAHDVLDDAMTNLASVALEKDLVDLSSAEGLAVAQARSSVESLQHEVDDHIAADSAYDTDAYALGIKVLGAIGVSLLVGTYLLAA